MFPPKRPCPARLRLNPLSWSLALFALLLTAATACAQADQTITVADGDVAGLITAINTLNTNGGGTIDLASSGSYSVSAPTDWWYGPNAFPAIASTITVNGNGATISRASGSSKFRFFFVSSGFSTLPAGSLTLNNLTLTGGLAQGGSGGSGVAGGGGGAGLGGAIYNQGTLTLSSVHFISNEAEGGPGGAGIGYGGATGAGGGLGGNGANINIGTYSPGIYSAGPGGGGFKSDGGFPGDNIFGSVNVGNGGNGGEFLGSEGGHVHEWRDEQLRRQRGEPVRWRGGGGEAAEDSRQERTAGSHLETITTIPHSLPAAAVARAEVRGPLAMRIHTDPAAIKAPVVVRSAAAVVAVV